MTGAIEQEAGFEPMGGGGRKPQAPDEPGRAPEPGASGREGPAGEPQQAPLVKFCGLRRAEDVAAANRTRPDFAGFVVDCPASRRSVSVERLRELRRLLDPDIAAVGVFVDRDPAFVAETARACGLDYVQLHGDETEADIARLRELGAPPVIQAFVVRDADDVRRARESSADCVLLDNGKGTGKAFDWSLVQTMGRPFFLSGGIDAETAGAAARLRPFALDVSSGIETDGCKDETKMEALLAAVRGPRQRMQAPAPGGETPPDRTGGRRMTARSKGRFGDHGGQYLPETLMSAVIELEEAYERYRDDEEFNAHLTTLLNEYANRPSRLYFAERMTRDLGGAKVYLKREDLNHTGAHKINNVLGQVLLAKKMGKTRVIAETGAGQHGVATATVAALMGMECEVFMGREDTERQALNVYRMRLLGAKVHAVDAGTATLKDAVSETMREWTSRIADTHYVLGSCMGPHPFPTIVRDFQAVISRETRQQCLEREGKLPDAVIACVGGGSNAIGSFYPFIEDEGVRLIGCEAAGRGVDTFETAATLSTGSLGIFHGMKSYFCQDEHGQIAPVYSISAGLDYPGVGPEHAWLHDIGRAEYVPVTDDEAVDAFEYLSRTEGIIPAIESAHALHCARVLAPQMDPDQTVVVTLSGRGDKDCAAIARYRGEDLHD